MTDIPLCPACNPHTTLETAHALQFQFEPPTPWRSVVVWRDGKKILRPIAKKRLRDLRAGDEVIYQDKREIHAVEIYR